MGVDKASLEFHPGVRQLDYQLGLLEPFCSRLGVCVGPASRSERSVVANVEVIFDLDDISGPMSGIVAALRAAEGVPILVIACDMPFLEASHLVQLLNRRDPEKLATCFLASDGKPDPMCAIYEAAALTGLEALAASEQTSLRRFLSGERIERVQPERPEFLASVNDPEQLAAARRNIGYL